MKVFLFGGLLAASLASAARPLDPSIVQQVKNDLHTAKIVPDILPEFEPSSFLKIQYPDTLVETGVHLQPHEVIEAPHIWFPAPDMDAQYTMIMVDADAEVPLVRHWISTNVPGGKPGSSLRDDDPIHLYTPYHGPTPPNDGKPHRYVFSLWQQKIPDHTFQPVLENPTENRAYFNLTEFTLTNQLIPIAANYILVGHEDGYDGSYLSGEDQHQQQQQQQQQQHQGPQ